MLFLFRLLQPIILFFIYSEPYFAALIKMDEFPENEWRAFVKFFGEIAGGHFPQFDGRDGDYFPSQCNNLSLD
jgi:hypothetical protein